MAEVTINTLVTDDAGVARVQVSIPGFSVSRTAASKKHPKDTPLRSVGEALALARAMRLAAEDLESFASHNSTIWNG